AVVPTSPAGVEISRMLLQAKLDGQAQVMSLLGSDAETKDAFDSAVRALAVASTLDQLVWAERDAALAYWCAWSSITVRFTNRDERLVPEHWRSLGRRGSQLTSGPRLATNPVTALLNYLYA